MSSPTRAPASPRPSVDLRDPREAEVALRISYAWRQLRRGASAVALRDYLFGVADDALEPGQMDALDVLLTRDRWRMSELADALHIDPSTATRAVQRLVNDGLVIRRQCDLDGRVVLVEPSEMGRRRHRAVAKRRVHVMSRLLSAFTPEQRRDLADLLGQFVHELDLLMDDLGIAGVREAGNRDDGTTANSDR